MRRISIILLILLSVFAGCTTHGTGKIEQIASAVYPEAPAYPDAESYTDREAYYKAQFEWLKYNKESAAQGKQSAGSLIPFYKTVLDAILFQEKEAEEVTERIAAPYSLYMTLAALAECAEGESLNEILSVAGESRADEANRTFQDHLPAVYQDNSEIISVPALSFWTSDTVTILPETVRKLTTEYATDIYTGLKSDAEYTDAARLWDMAHSGKKMSGFAPSYEEAAVDLISAMRYSASWTSPTEDAEILVARNPLIEAPERIAGIQITESVPYFTSMSLAMAGFPIKNGGYMWIVIPRSITLRDCLRDEDMWSILAGSKLDRTMTTNVRLVMPVVDITAVHDLQTVFEALGITKIFEEEQADLSHLTEEVDTYIANAKQSLSLKINKDGINRDKTAEQGETQITTSVITMVTENPFLLFITASDDTILYACTVNPTAA